VADIQSAKRRGEGFTIDLGVLRFELKRLAPLVEMIARLKAESLDAPMVTMGEFASTSAHGVMFNVALYLANSKPEDPSGMFAPPHHNAIAALLDHEATWLDRLLRRSITFQQALGGMPGLGLPPIPQRTLYRWVNDPRNRDLLGLKKGVAPRLQKLAVDGLKQLVEQQGSSGNSRQTKRGRMPGE